MQNAFVNTMNDLTESFPGCKLTTAELRETIRSITQMPDSGDSVYYFCYRCFKYLGVNNPSSAGGAVCCKVCYQFYCHNCAIGVSVFGAGKEIDSKKCLQCIENATNLAYLL